MTIQSIKLEHTHPSLGPHETRTTITLTVNEDNSQKINEFIKNATINNITSLYEYLKAIRTKNTKILNSVFGNSPIGKLNEGSAISHLFFYFEDAPVIKLTDVYRRFELTHFKPGFTGYMLEKGIVDRDSSNRKDPLKTRSLGNIGSDEANETGQVLE